MAKFGKFFKIGLIGLASIVGFEGVQSCDFSLITGIEYLAYPSTPQEPVAEITGADTISVYRKWWGEMEDCLHVKKDFDKIRWFQVLAYSFTCPDGDGQCFGEYYRPSHTIYLAQSQLFVEEIVKYEIGHPMGLHDNNPRYSDCGLDPSNIANHFNFPPPSESKHIDLSMPFRK